MAERETNSIDRKSNILIKSLTLGGVQGALDGLETLHNRKCSTLAGEWKEKIQFNTLFLTAAADRLPLAYFPLNQTLLPYAATYFQYVSTQLHRSREK